MAPKVAKAEGKVKKASKRKDGPKKAPSAYIIFCSDKRPEVRANNPEATFGELGKLLGKIWADMSEADKEMYRTRQAEMKAEIENKL
mmetsp:Transcript_3036/g.3207  ORF Transcript_3036/g.3207 Transcript_3036/m.3207 type:complete len:87 (-) Transcript_3036:398-658(-)|eukprot:CAMPEP_0182416836 /NCGR_PEP_ID=MMETSP1167-20130531/1216_1 /TAXON_ID=2988 /ORGANISM="Mallomonas Sp, Strain CCMP3275" /LENGTH=86 /DNA_ID=CAMNT_0024589949 /DNA_START=31 /DNA_END=291 /DNA_ORIENTATION=+